MTHGSLFSGVGGFDLAAQWMGWENVFHCEINPFCKTNLKYYHPNAISYNDIKTTDFSIHRETIDILTGGFPCQPWSVAGKQLGKEDERHLWPEMLRAIREIQPRWVVGENVRGLINWNGGMVFDEVQADLETAGYEVFPFLLPAAGVNAPHERYRIWFVAYTNCERVQIDQSGIVYDGDRDSESEARSGQQSSWVGAVGESESTANSKSQQSERMQFEQREACKQEQGESGRSDSKSATSNSDGIGLRRESNGLGITKQSDQNSKGNNWANFPTQSPICSGDDGLSSRLHGITFSKWRAESIKAYGNAIVPQVVLQIFKAIQQYEQNI